MCVCEEKSASECVCVREREREEEGVSKCVRVWMCLYARLSMYV